LPGIKNGLKTNKPMIRLAIIEDNIAYSTALEMYIKSLDGILIVYLGKSVSGLVADKALSPDVVIMDIDLGKESGIDGVPKVKQAYPKAGIIMLTVFEDEEKIFQSIKAGALGYILKKDPPTKIAEAIQNIYKGESVMNGQIARKVLDYFSTPRAALNLEIYHLTKREKEILLLLMDGLSYKQIAAKCFISIDTLNSHIRKVYTKLNVHSRSEIAAKFR
jgi:DNA-binding NarL/FixJ family response regulator